MPVFRSDYAVIYYETTGHGPPLVLTHGATLDHHQWTPQIKALAKDFLIISWDVRGHGRSVTPPGTFQHHEAAADLIRLLDHLHIEKAHMCGLSMGAAISLEAAVTSPHRTASLILMNSYHSLSTSGFRKLFAPLTHWTRRFVPRLPVVKTQAKLLARFNRNNQPYIEQTVRSMPKTTWSQTWHGLSETELTGKLEKVSCPVLLMHGKQDLVTKNQQNTLFTRLAGATRLELDDSHHLMNLDQPEQVNEAIHSFLKEVDN
ncbi:alpha/beta fold hydrolase [Alkalicoccus luteus]|uniref:alpha/beta fold hydrolase n=1 Tax=Alkalicoccus luteus TaxID=1237094 RepID=UPI004034132D